MHDDERRLQKRTEIREMLEGWRDIPAFLRDRHLNVIAANDLARAVSPSFNEGVNLVRFTFVDAAVDRDDPRYPVVSAQIAALLRDSLDQHHDDDAFRDIVGELSARSHDFAEAWAQEQHAADSGVVMFVTPVGRINLSFQQLEVPGVSGDVLMVWRPVEHSDKVSLTRLAELSSGLSEE